MSHDSYERRSLIAAQEKLWIVRDLERDGHIVLPTLIGQSLSGEHLGHLKSALERPIFGHRACPWADEPIDYYGAGSFRSVINNYDPLSYFIPGTSYNGLLQW